MVEPYTQDFRDRLAAEIATGLPQAFPTAMAAVRDDFRIRAQITVCQSR